MLRAPSPLILGLLIVATFLALRALGIEGWEFGPGSRWRRDAAMAQTGQGPVSGRAFVVDGDTLDVRGHRIRLWGIDAPEGGQLCRQSDGEIYACGRAAARALAAHLRGAELRCVPRDRDRYGRMVGQCFAGDDDISRWLVREGWALAWPRAVSHPYAGDQRSAEQARRGLWQGRFMPPAEWRRAERFE